MRHLMLSALILLLSAGSALAEVKIAFVDMQRALLEVEDGKTAKGKLEKMKKERQENLDARQEELRALQKQFEAQKEFMKEDVRKQKEEEFRQKLGELQLTYAKLQKELAEEEAKLTKGIFTRMARILKSVGEAENFSMVFEKTESSILWAPQHLDLTNEVIRRYNAGEGKEDKKKDEKKDK
jgi:outer membrane protein